MFHEKYSLEFFIDDFIPFRFKLRTTTKQIETLVVRMIALLFIINNSSKRLNGGRRVAEGVRQQFDQKTLFLRLWKDRTYFVGTTTPSLVSPLHRLLWRAMKMLAIRIFSCSFSVAFQQKIFCSTWVLHTTGFFKQKRVQFSARCVLIISRGNISAHARKSKEVLNTRIMCHNSICHWLCEHNKNIAKKAYIIQHSHITHFFRMIRHKKQQKKEDVYET